jgi:hypothetical protein
MNRRPRRPVLIFALCLGMLVTGVLVARSFSRVLPAPGPPGVASAQPLAATAVHGATPPALPTGDPRIIVPVVQPPGAVRPQVISPSPTPQGGIGPTPTLDGGEPGWDARIEIVWPHDGADIRDARLANITAYLTAPGTQTPPACAAEPVVRLWRAVNTKSAHPIAVGTKRLITLQGHTFPAWDFNDVDVSALSDTANRMLFFATVDGAPTHHNVWIHGTDARTVFPQPDVPPGLTNHPPLAVDARVEVLWPHDNRPLEQATLANLTAYLFDAATGKALAPDTPWHPKVRLHWSLNNAADEGLASSRTGVPRTVAGPNGMRFLAWDFNDVDVSAAQDPRNRLHFWVTVDDAPTVSNIWTHGAMAPTIHPEQQALDSCR